MCAVRTSVREPSRAAASSAHRERAPRVAAGLAYDGWWSALCRALTGGASQAGPAAVRRGQLTRLEQRVPSILDRVLRIGEGRILKKLANIAHQVNALEDSFSALSDAGLHLGNIAEMKTGEGKTLVATLPASLNALTGKGVHVVTVNDYLASYQS